MCTIVTSADFLVALGAEDETRDATYTLEDGRPTFVKGGMTSSSDVGARFVSWSVLNNNSAWDYAYFYARTPEGKDAETVAAALLSAAEDYFTENDG